MQRVHKQIILLTHDGNKLERIAEDDLVYNSDGTIENGADGNREFKFTNTGDAPLVITNAKGSCGCTVPTWPRTPIAPGASDVIKVRYATNRTGGFSKTITLTTNAVNSPSVRLRIKGTVKPKVEEAKETETKEEVH